QFRVGRIFDDLIIVMDGSSDDWVTQFLDDITDNIVVRNTDTYSFLFRAQQFRDLGARIEDKGKWTRQCFFQYPKNGGVKGLGILRNIRQVITDKGKVSLVRFQSADRAHALYGLLVCNVATNTIYRICWIDNHASFS